jgi:hypothetical protein
MSIANLGNAEKRFLKNREFSDEQKWVSDAIESDAVSQLKLQNNGQSVRGFFSNFAITTDNSQKFINWPNKILLEDFPVRFPTGQTAINIGSFRSDVAGTHEIGVIQLHQLDAGNPVDYTIGLKRGNDGDWPAGSIKVENTNFSFY